MDEVKWHREVQQIDGRGEARESTGDEQIEGIYVSRARSESREMLTRQGEGKGREM